MSDSYEMSDTCATCGECYGRHLGLSCRINGGQFVLADQPATIGPFGSGATLTTKGGYITGRTEPEPQRSPLPNSDAWRYTGKQREHFPGFTATHEQVIELSAPAPRPVFKGSTLHAHPGMGAALLRG